MTDFKSTESSNNKKNMENDPKFKRFYGYMFQNILTDFSDIKEGSLFESIKAGRDICYRNFKNDEIYSLFRDFEEPKEIFRFWACIASIEKISSGNGNIFYNQELSKDVKEEKIETNNKYIGLYEQELYNIVRDVWRIIIRKNDRKDSSFRLTFKDRDDMVEVLTRYYHVCFNWNVKGDYISHNNRITAKSDNGKIIRDYDLICKDIARLFGDVSCDSFCQQNRQLFKCWNNIHFDFGYEVKGCKKEYQLDDKKSSFKQIVKAVVEGSSNKFDISRLESTDSSFWGVRKYLSTNSNGESSTTNDDKSEGSNDVSDFEEFRDLNSFNMTKDNLLELLYNFTEYIKDVDRYKNDFFAFFDRIKCKNKIYSSKELISLWKKSIGESEVSYEEALKICNLVDDIRKFDSAKSEHEFHGKDPFIDFLRRLPNMYLDKMATLLEIPLKDDPVFHEIYFDDDSLPVCLDNFESVNGDGLDVSIIKSSLQNYKFMKELFDLSEVRNYYLRELRSLNYSNGFTVHYYFSTWIKSMEPSKLYCIMFYKFNYNSLVGYDMRFLINWRAKFKNLSPLIIKGVNLNEKFSRVANQKDIQMAIPRGEEYQKKLIDFANGRSADFQDFMKEVYVWNVFFTYFFNLEDKDTFLKGLEKHYEDYVRKIEHLIEKGEQVLISKSQLSDVFNKITTYVKEQGKKSMSKNDIREYAWITAESQYSQGWRSSPGNSKFKKVNLKNVNQSETMKYASGDDDVVGRCATRIYTAALSPKPPPKSGTSIQDIDKKITLEI